MNSRITALAAPALAALSICAAAAPAQAARAHHDLWRARPHRHEAMPPSVSGSAPGIQAVALQLPAASYNVATQSQLLAALQSAQPGQVIHLASGSRFSDVWDMKSRTGWVTLSGAGDAVTPVIAGANLEGSQYLRFTNIEFTQRIFIGHSPTQGGSQPAENIQILNSDLNCGSTQTDPKTHGVAVRQSSQNITLIGDWVHNCTVGLTTVAQDNPVQNLTVEHDLFEDFYGDAIDLGGANGTVIADNIIQNIKHSPGVDYHDDGIQFLGNTNSTVIQNNVLDNSNDQLIFIQDAVKGLLDGVQTNSNVVVDHNLIYGAGAAAVQDEGAVNLRFTDNTIWDANDAAMIVRKSPYTGTPAASSVITGNILQNYMQMSAPGREGDNLITWVSPQVKKILDPTDITGVTPGFVNPATGDFALLPGTPGSGQPGTGVTLTTGVATTSNSPATTSTAATATMVLGANPQNYPFGAPLFGVKS
jgi:parallel beta helix pectate lyase-like protein